TYALSILLSAVGLVSLLRAEEESAKVYRNVTPEKLEAILADLKIKFQKVKGKEEGVAFYDFERNKYKIRLHNYQGKDLWIDAHFSDKVNLAEINQWNIRAKFSRAVLLKGDDNPSVSLEAQLDCVGGTADILIRQFIERFDGEIVQFVKFLSK